MDSLFEYVTYKVQPMISSNPNLDAWLTDNRQLAVVKAINDRVPFNIDHMNISKVTTLIYVLIVCYINAVVNKYSHRDEYMNALSLLIGYLRVSTPVYDLSHDDQLMRKILRQFIRLTKFFKSIQVKA